MKLNSRGAHREAWKRPSETFAWRTVSLCKAAVAGFSLAFFLQVPGLPARSDPLVEKSRRAKEAMQAQRFDEAVELYRQLVRAIPANPGLRMNLGLALHSTGKYREAAREFGRVLKDQPQSASAWLFLGLAHLKLGEPEAAVEPLRRSLTYEPGNSVARLELGTALLAVGQPAEAVREFQRLVESDPTSARSWQGIGLSYLAISHQAFEALEQAAPDSSFALTLLGRSLLARGQNHAAFNLLRQAVHRPPKLRGVFADLAEVYRRTGHPEWAALAQEKEAALPPPDCASTSLECHFLSGRFSEILEATSPQNPPEKLYWRSRAASELALQAFARLAALPPSSALYELLAEVHRIQGRPDLAVAAWKSALELAPDDKRLRKGLAVALRVNREYEAARSLIEELVRSEPESPEMNFELGETLSQLGRPEEAIPFLEKSVRLAPQNVQARASLGRAYLRLGEAAKAIPHLEAARDVEADGRLHYQLAQAYQKTGQSQLARESLDKFEEISRRLRARRHQLPEEFEITPP